MPIQIANRFVWQDNSQNHITTVQIPDAEEVFRVSYKPEAAGNKLWIQINGTGGSGEKPGAPKRNWAIYMAYSADAGKTWNPPKYPGPRFPSAGLFMANIGFSAWQNPDGDFECRERAEGYLLCGELTVPEGAPEIVFKVMLGVNAGNCPDANMLGGSMVHITEYSPKT